MAPVTPTPRSDNERTLAAVAYILTWLTGLIILLVANKEDKYARWHAIQAIGFGIAVTVLYIVLGMLPIPFLGLLLNLAVLVLVIVLAVKAYQNQTIRLPVVADFADKNA